MMFEPITLILNLNEIMDKYAELEDQTVQTTQTVAEQVEERVDVNDELELTVEEFRKRKRGNEEAENSNKRLVNGSLTWRILLGETSYSTETSLGREASTNGFPPSKS